MSQLNCEDQQQIKIADIRVGIKNGKPKDPQSGESLCMAICSKGRPCCNLALFNLPAPQNFSLDCPAGRPEEKKLRVDPLDEISLCSIHKAKFESRSAESPFSYLYWVPEGSQGFLFACVAKITGNEVIDVVKTDNKFKNIIGTIGGKISETTKQVTQSEQFQKIKGQVVDTAKAAASKIGEEVSNQAQNLINNGASSLTKKLK